jgi:hypothetical protein
VKEKSRTIGQFIDDDANRWSIANGAASSGDLSARNQKPPGVDSKASKSLTPLTGQYHKFAVPVPGWENEYRSQSKRFTRTTPAATLAVF